MTDPAMQQVTSGLRRMRRKLGVFAIGMGGLVLFLLLANISCGSQFGDGTAWWIVTSSLFALSILSGRTVFSLVRHDPNTLWTPAALFPLSTLLFFGLGSMSILFGNEATHRALLAGNYGLDETGLMRTLLLTTTGVTVCVAFLILGSRISFSKTQGSSGRAVFSLPLTAAFFVVSGAVLKYGLVLPAQWGLINITVPGTLKSMTGLIDLGLAVIAYMAARGDKSWLLIFLLIWPVHLGLCLLELSKQVTMFAILLPAAGAYLAHRNWKRLLPWIVFAAIVFSILQGINTSARMSILAETGSITEAGFGERVEILRKAFSGDSDSSQLVSAGEEVQDWWLRLNYSGAQLRAMELYESGRPGEWSLSIIYVLIPRFIWPGKPESVSQGRIFNQTVSGNAAASSRVGISVYADGYWLMGWPGVFLFSAIMGMILGVITRVNYRLIVGRQLIYFPVIFLGMNMAALGPMGYLEKTFVGALPIYCAYLLIISIASRLRFTAPRGNSPSI